MSRRSSTACELSGLCGNLLQALLLSLSRGTRIPSRSHPLQCHDHEGVSRLPCLGNMMENAIL